MKTTTAVVLATIHVMAALMCSAPARAQEKPMKPAMVMPHEVKAASFEQTQDAATVNTSRQLIATIKPIPMPEFCSAILGMSAKVRVTLHAGGGDDLYRFGTSAFTATLRGELVGYVGLGKVTLATGVILQIDQNHPEATFIYDGADLLERSAYIDMTYESEIVPNPATVFDAIGFELWLPGPVDPGFYTNATGDIYNALRVELVYEHVLRAAVPSDLEILTYPDPVANTFATLPGSPGADAASLITNSRVRLAWSASDEGCENDLDYVDGWQIQIARIYNTEITYSTSPYSVFGKLDWNNALSLTTDPDARNVDITLTEGEGVYAFRVRPVLVDKKHADQARQAYGVWSPHPVPDGDGNVELDMYDCEYGDWTTSGGGPVADGSISVFYHQSETSCNRTYTRQAASETNRRLVNTESMSFLDANMTPLQNQHINAAEDVVIVNENFLDNEGRNTSTTLPAPMLSHRQMAYEPLLNAVGSSGTGRPFDARDFDDDAKIAAPTLINPMDPAGTAKNDISWYYSNSNPDLRIPSADGYIASRTLFNGEGRPSVISKPGSVFRMGSSTGAQDKVMYGSAADIELTSVFGSEAPAASSVSKTVNTNADGVSTVTYFDLGGNIIATCLAGGSELDGHVTAHEIDEDGSGTLLNLNGNTGSANAIKEKVNEIEIKYELMKGAEKTPGTFIASKRIVVAAATTLTVDYTPYLRDVTSSGSCVDYCYTCDWKTTIRATRVDPLPMIRAATEVVSPSPASETLFRDCESTTSTSTQTITLPSAGTWLIERVVQFNTPVSTTNGNTWNQEHQKSILSELQTLDELYAELFDIPGGGPVPSAADQLSSYRARYAESRKAVLYAEASVDGPCGIDLPAEQPCPVDVCVAGEGEDTRFEEHFIEQWLIFKGASSDEAAIEQFKTDHAITMLFRTDALSVSNTAPATDKQIYPATLPGTGGWGIFEQMVENMMAETDGGSPALPLYTCKDIWNAWRGAVAMKVAGHVDDVLQTFLDIVGRHYSGMYTGGTTSAFYTEPGAYAYHAYELVYCPSSMKCSQCASDISAHYNPIPTGEKYYQAIAACVGTDETTERDKVDDQDGFVDPFDDPLGFANRATANQIALTKCNNACEDRRDQFMRQLRQVYNITRTEAELLCMVEALVDECRTACDAAFPTTGSMVVAEAVRKEGIKRIYGIPRVVPSLEGVCLPPHTTAQLNPGKTVLQMLAIHLTDWYNKQVKAATSKQCKNIAPVIRDFLLNAGKTVPTCVTDAVALTAGVTDCTYNPPITLRRYFVTILPGQKGRFYTETDANAECENCSLVFDGPTDYIANHPMVPVMNDFLDDFWGMKVTDIGLSMIVDSVTTRTSPTDAIYYKYWGTNDGTPFEYHPTLQARVDQLLYDAYMAGEGVNGAQLGQYPIWTSTLYPYATEEYERPPITLFTNDQWLVSIYDTTMPAIPEWNGAYRHYGFTAFSFAEKNTTKVNRHIVGGLIRDNFTGTALETIRLITDNGTGVSTQVFPVSDNNDELRAYTEAPFTSIFGSFGQNAQGMMTYRDQVNNQVIPMTDLIFFYRKARTMLGTSVSCVVDHLCEQAPCKACVIYDLIDPNELDHERGRDMTPIPCEEDELRRLKNEIALRYSAQRAKLAKSISDVYMKSCMNIEGFNDKVTVKYSEKYYHYTLSYYDRAGRLQRTVPPRGVDIDPTRTRTTRPGHSMETIFTHSSAGETRTETAPDRSTTTYWYDSKGRMRFSQDAVQATSPEKLNYFTYDILGRMTEHGELDVPTSPPTTTAAFATAYLESDAYLSTVTARRDITRTFYTTPASSVSGNWTPVQSAYSGIEQKRLRGRVSWTETIPDLSTLTTDVVRTYYSYDAHGGVEWMVTDIPRDQSSSPARMLKRVDYTYDQALGIVRKTVYQKGEADQFIHLYETDANGMIVKSYTSRDAINWNRDAQFTYNKSQQLARMVLGEDQVQGVDYTYKLDGALKGMNHPSLDPVQDPGGDAKSGGTNEGIPNDVFGYSLGYHTGDFSRSYSSTASSFNSTNDSLWQPAASLYSGLVGSMTYRTREITPGSTDIVRDGALLSERYVYDRIGRLRASTSAMHTGSSFTSDGTDGWATSFMYDPHGNMLDIRRSAMENASTHVLMDQLAITLKSGPRNTPDVMVESGVGVAGFTGDLKDMSGANSAYDAAGRATKLSDNNLSIDATWNSQHLGKTIDIGSHEKMRILRNANGAVVRYSPDDGTGTYWYMVPGAQGEERARYSSNGADAPVLVEWPVYTSGKRLGVSRDVGTHTVGQYERVVGKQFYELTDRSGSVRAIVADIRKDVSNQNTPVLVSTVDYDVFGFVRPNRSLDLALLTSDYSYGFQGMKSLWMIGSSDLYSTPGRVYDGRRGSWITSDPKANDEPGWSPYRAFFDNPLSWTDPSGFKEYPDYAAFVDDNPSAHPLSRDDMPKMGHWLTSDRLENNTIWKEANRYNFVNNNQDHYEAFAQIRDFYIWLQTEVDQQHHEIKWLKGALSLVTKLAANLEDGSMFVNDDVEAVMRKLNKAIQNAVMEPFQKLLKLDYVGPRLIVPLKGKQAEDWDRGLIWYEQTTIANPVYEKISPETLKKFQQLADRSGGWHGIVGSISPPAPPFNYFDAKVTDDVARIDIAMLMLYPDTHQTSWRGFKSSKFRPLGWVDMHGRLTHEGKMMIAPYVVK